VGVGRRAPNRDLLGPTRDAKISFFSTPHLYFYPIYPSLPRRPSSTFRERIFRSAAGVLLTIVHNTQPSLRTVRRRFRVIRNGARVVGHYFVAAPRPTTGFLSLSSARICCGNLRRTVTAPVGIRTNDEKKPPSPPHLSNKIDFKIRFSRPSLDGRRRSKTRHIHTHTCVAILLREYRSAGRLK